MRHRLASPIAGYGERGGMFMEKTITGNEGERGGRRSWVGGLVAKFQCNWLMVSQSQGVEVAMGRLAVGMGLGVGVKAQSRNGSGNRAGYSGEWEVHGGCGVVVRQKITTQK
uniref:Uncharacterized protein n=1 Tax=Knipowitschia caucasica TaxID=637954 RepID=A0AAV2LDP4_KNICA